MTDTNLSSLFDWLDYLERRHLEPIQLGLERVKVVADKLDLLSIGGVVITVAGTNGKGSTVAALSAIYSAAGYQVGTYTSPHLLHFNERICVNEVPISDETLCDAFNVIHAIPESLSLTYFEMTTLAALWYFKQVQPAVVILEVGMGGRLDATNVIDADACIITTIDLDHQYFLGSTREAIAYEKAGIMRGNKPMIYADIDPPASLINYARSTNAEAYFLGEFYSFYTIEDSLVLILPEIGQVKLPRPAINAQAMAVAVVMSMLLKKSLPVAVSDWVLAAGKANILGRLQAKVDDRGVNYLFDVAHNPQAVRHLAQELIDNKRQGKVHAVFSALKDKDLCGLIKPIGCLVQCWYPAILQGDRATDKLTLQKAFDDVINDAPECYYENPVLAFNEAKAQAQPGDLIVVYGSFLTVAAVMASQI